MALVTAIVAWGLWTLQEWARILTIIFNGIFLALGILHVRFSVHPSGRNNLSVGTPRYQWRS